MHYEDTSFPVQSDSYLVQQYEQHLKLETWKKYKRKEKRRKKTEIYRWYLKRETKNSATVQCRIGKNQM